MAREYDAFMDNPEELKKEKKEMVILVRELTPENRKEKYCSKKVRAEIHPKPEEGDDILYLRYQRGYLYPEKFGIKILEELSVI